MDMSILQRPLCYKSFEVKEKLLRCAQCKCAWYASREEQKSHWRIHKTVCKEPDFTMISKLSGEQCYKILETMFLKIDHNTAAMLERMYQFIREESRKEDTNSDNFSISDFGLRLHSFTRMSSNNNVSMDIYYKTVWAVPGMPQFLLLTDLRSVAYTEVVKRFPSGRPFFESEDEDIDFEMKYMIESDDTGEVLGWFVIGFLIRSCVDGPIAMTSNHDGRGNLRNYKFCEAAMLKIAQIYSTPELRGSAMKSMYPVPGFFLNIAQNKPDMLINVLNVGAFSGIIEWADEQYSLDLMKIISTLDTKALDEEIKFEILSLCCNPFGNTSESPWYSSGDNDSEQKILNVCSNIAVKILVESPNVTTFLERALMSRQEKKVPVWTNSEYGAKRIVLAFLHQKVNKNDGVVNKKLLKCWLKEWKKIETHNYPELAMKVMDQEFYERWLEKTKSSRASYGQQGNMEAGITGRREIDEGGDVTNNISGA